MDTPENLSVGSVASFRTFQASLPRPRHKGRGAMADDADGVDNGLDGVEAREASALWRRIFAPPTPLPPSAAATAGGRVKPGPAGETLPIDISDLHTDVRLLPDAALLERLRTKFGRLSAELDAADAALAALDAAAAAAAADKENEADVPSIEVGRLAPEAKARSPFRDPSLLPPTPQRRGVLQPLSGARRLGPSRRVAVRNVTLTNYSAPCASDGMPHADNRASLWDGAPSAADLGLDPDEFHSCSTRNCRGGGCHGSARSLAHASGLDQPKGHPEWQTRQRPMQSLARGPRARRPGGPASRRCRPARSFPAARASWARSTACRAPRSRYARCRQRRYRARRGLSAA